MAHDLTANMTYVAKTVFYLYKQTLFLICIVLSVNCLSNIPISFLSVPLCQYRNENLS